MKKITYTLLLLAVLLCGCSRDDEALPEQGMPLKLKITDAGFFPGDDAPGTRTSEQHYYTTFEAGDMIGITCVYDGGIVDWMDNIPFLYDGTSWIPQRDTKINYYNAVTYIAYYPWSYDMDGKLSEQAIIDAFTPETDQSGTGYSASDLLVATGTADKATLTLSFDFRHAMAMVSFKVSNSATDLGVDLGSTLTINGGKPYLDVRENNTYKYLMKPGNQSVEIMYELGGYKTTTNMEAGKIHQISLPLNKPLYNGKTPNLLAIPGKKAYWVAPVDASESTEWSKINFSTICPAGWHVPTKDDFLAMTDGSPEGYNAITKVFPIYTYPVIHSYWSSTAAGNDPRFAWLLWQPSEGKSTIVTLVKSNLCRVRCVKAKL